MHFQHNISLLFGRIEARRHAEFTGVELAAPVEKAAADLARVITAPVEKAVRTLEKAAVGSPCDIEGVQRCFFRSTEAHGAEWGEWRPGSRRLLPRITILREVVSL